ncbi:MAG: phosphoglycolate phosphatase [Woeseiaceae bacterium]
MTGFNVTVAGDGGIFFDLDGTLVDTAPDMVAVLAALQKDNGSAPLPYEVARASVSHGAFGLIDLAFPGVGDEERSRLHREYLERYEQAVCIGSTLFPGLTELLDRLDRHGTPWGVVTNKPQRMTEPLLEKLGLRERMSCAISGDTLPQRKPHPAPLLLACEQAGVEPTQSIYAGDDARDIIAGRAAGMTTIAATYGYIVADDDPVLWQADHVATNPRELAKLILKAVSLDT